MKQIFKATAILVIAPLVFFVTAFPVFATDTECTPPYEGTVTGPFSTQSACTAAYCVYSQSNNAWYGYSSAKVGNACTNDNTREAGICDGSSNCSPCPDGSVCLPNPLSVSTFDALLNKIIDFIFWVGITVAPVIFIIAGFLFVTSAGDAKKLETAKHMMLYTVIGLVVLLLARGLVAVLKSVIGVQ